MKQGSEMVRITNQTSSDFLLLLCLFFTNGVFLLGSMHLHSSFYLSISCFPCPCPS